MTKIILSFLQICFCSVCLQIGCHSVSVHLCLCVCVCVCVCVCACVCACVCVGSRQIYFRPIQVDESCKHQTRLSRRFFWANMCHATTTSKEKGNRIISPLSLIKNTATLYKSVIPLRKNQTKMTKGIRRMIETCISP